MALVLCIICSSLAGLGAYALVGAAHADAHVAMLRIQSAKHALRRFVRGLSKGALVAWLMERKAFAEAASEVSQWLGRRGVGLDQHEAASLLAMACILLAALLGVCSASLVAPVIVLCALWAAMCFAQATRARRLERELAQEMPGVLRTMATSLESGNTLVQAIEYVGLHEKGHAASSFVRASLRLRCGMSMEDTLDELRRELVAPGVDLMVTALTISQRTGSPLRALLQRSAVLVEQQEEFERLLAVRTAQVRMSVRVVCSLPVIMVVLLALVSPDYQQGLLTPSGIACIVVAAAMDGIALLLIRRIMGGVL